MSWGAQSLDCSALDKRPTPETAQAWFARSLSAGRCYNFEALAVRVGPGGIRTFEIVHRVSDEGERESLRFLDGPPSRFQQSDTMMRRWYTGESSHADDTANAATVNDHGATIAALEQHYRFEIAGHDRIADHRAVVVDILPEDALRFGHRLWLDEDSGLLLKQQLFNSEGQPLEIVQVARLGSLSLFEGTLDASERDAVPDSDWRPAWLPEGFHAQPVRSDVKIDGVTMHHQLFSDGLSTLSVFMGPAKAPTSLREGVHRLGNFRAASRHFKRNQQSWQLVAVGEVPTEVLTRVVSGVRWRSDEPAETSPDSTLESANPS